MNTSQYLSFVSKWLEENVTDARELCDFMNELEDRLVHFHNTDHSTCLTIKANNKFTGEVVIVDAEFTYSPDYLTDDTGSHYRDKHWYVWEAF